MIAINQHNFGAIPPIASLSRAESTDLPGFLPPGTLIFEFRSVFNMSGRRRLSFESDGNWQGPMSLYLVVIGVGIDHAEVLAALEGMRVDKAALSA